jgi:hypothetical protein
MVGTSSCGTLVEQEIQRTAGQLIIKNYNR